MAEAKFTLKIFTPAGLLLEEETSAVTLPSAVGEIQVLPQHAKYIGALGVGILEYISGTASKRMVVSGGFATFSSDTLTILADAVDLPGKIDKKSLSAQREKFQATIDAGDTLIPQWQQAKNELARLDAIERL